MRQSANAGSRGESALVLLADDAEPMGTRLAALLGTADYGVVRARTVAEAERQDLMAIQLVLLDAELGGFTVTRKSELLGTPYYVAPERVNGGEVGPPTDVCSLTVVLFESLTGKLPFPTSDDAWEASGEPNA